MNNHSHFIYSKSIIKPELEIKIIEFANSKPSAKKISSFLNTNFSIDATDDKDIISAIKYANRQASRVVSKRGTSVPD